MIALKPLIYFSIFNHPLTEDEVFRFSETTNKEELKKDIDQLIDKGIIHKIGEFFLFENTQDHLSKRIEGNTNATAVMPKAKKVGAFISKFPFIKGVAISGSLSKGYFDDESDFDFFVITKAKRVWITRTFLAFYKRFFLSNSYKEFCVNYFISTNSLEIEEKNRFTATEIITAIPLFGKEIFIDFYEKNNWVINYFPNFRSSDACDTIQDTKTTTFTKVLGFLLDNFIGTSINFLLMRIITKRWFFKYNRKASNNPYKSKEEISKHHPENFQGRVLRKLNTKYEFCRQKYNINIPREYE